MSLVRLNIQGISYSQTQTGAYALILTEKDGERKLPIVIGAFEAQSIAIAMENEIKPPRPLTHDLFKNFAERFDVIVKQVIIHKLVDGVFFSSLICERDGIEEIIDARTSDAVALAVRFDAPIFTYKSILDQAGIMLDVNLEADEDEDVEAEEAEADLELEEILAAVLFEDDKDDIATMPLEELEEKMAQAVANEDYEQAAKFRDEIEKRNKN
jgi:bifunctional DNase/RNase